MSEKVGNELYAILTHDVPGQEGSIMGVGMAGIPGMVPAVTTNPELLALFVEVARRTGRKFRVVRFTNPEDVTAIYTKDFT